MEIELVRYEKIITLNNWEIENFEKCAYLLLQYMKDNNKKNNQCLEYLKLRLKDSEKGRNAKDLKLEWAVIGKRPSTAKKRGKNV